MAIYMFRVGVSELMIVWSMFFSGFGMPMGIVPGEEDPYLSQIAPEDCVLYSSWSGTAPADPAKNVTEKWIAQEEIQTFWKKLFTEIERFRDMELNENLSEGFGFEVRPILLKLPELALTQPGAMFITRATEEGMSGNFVFKLGEWEDGVAADLEKIDEGVLWERETEHGMEVLVLKDLLGFGDEVVVKAGIHKGYLMVAFSFQEGKASFDEVFASEKTPEPKWLTEIKNELPIERRGSIAMIDAERLVKLFEDSPGGMEFNPFVGARRIGCVTGVDGSGYLSRTWIQTEGELGAFFKAFEGEPLGAKELREIPSNQTLSMVSRLSPEQIYNGIEEAAESTTGGKQDFEEMVAGFEGFAGMTLKEDLLEKVDDYAFLYTDLEMEKIMGDSLPFLLGVGIKDEMAFLDTFEAFSLRIQEMVDENPELEFESNKVNDVQIHKVTNSRRWAEFPKVCFAQMGSKLLISNDFEKLKMHIVNAENAKPEETMFSQPEIKNLFEFSESIGCEGPLSIFRFDTRKALDRYWNMLAMLAGAAPAGDEDDFQLPKLPGADTMTNGQTPTVAASFRTKNGYQLYQRSVTPFPALIFPNVYWGVSM